MSCLLAACGGSSTSTPAKAGSAAAGSTTFLACLKSHGVSLPNRRTGFRGPTGAGGPPAGGPPPGGGTVFFGGGGGFRANPKLRAAVQACGGTRFRGAARFRLSHTAINKFVACVRQHGYNLPAPNVSGNGPVFPSNIRSNAKFRAASRSCLSLLRPAGAPSAGAPPGASGPSVPPGA